MGELSPLHWLLALLGLANIAMILHIAVSSSTRGAKKAIWVLLALLVPVIPYLAWKLIYVSSSTVDSGSFGMGEATGLRDHRNSLTESPGSGLGIASSAFTPSVELEEKIWATALAEFEANTRKPGLWARAFAETEGNESAAKAKYLQLRAHQLFAEHAARMRSPREL